MFNALTALSHPNDTSVVLNHNLPSDMQPIYGYYHDLKLQVQAAGVALEDLITDIRVEDFTLPHTADSVLITADSTLKCNDLFEVDYWQMQVRQGNKPLGLVKYRHLENPVVLQWDQAYFLHSAYNGTRWFSTSPDELPTDLFALIGAHRPITVQEVTNVQDTYLGPVNNHFRRFIDLRLLSNALPAVDGFYTAWVEVETLLNLPVSYLLDLPCNHPLIPLPQYYTPCYTTNNQFVVKVPMGRTLITLVDKDLNHYATKMLPEARSGLLPCAELLANMTVGRVEDLWAGLLQALAEQDIDAMLTQIAGIAKLMLNADDQGLPNSFYRISLTPIDRRVDIYQNAMVGIALAACLRFLQDRPPVQYISLEGWRDRINYLITTLYDVFNGALAQDDWVAAEYDPEYQVYYEKSLSASLAVSIAYGDLLACYYDEASHFRAARLFLTILDSLNPPDDSYYSGFVDAAAVIRNLALKLHWCQRYGLDLSRFRVLYASLVDVPKRAGDDLYNQAVLWTVLLIPDLTIPDTAYTPLFANWYGTLTYSALVNLIKADYKFYAEKDEPFALRALDARAFVIYAQQLAAALWPKGNLWPDVALNPNTQLGGFLAAVAETGFEWFLRHAHRRGTLLDGSREVINKWQPLQPFRFEYQTEAWARRWLWQAINTPTENVVGVSTLCKLYGLWIPEPEDTSNRPTADLDVSADDIFTVDAQYVVRLANEYGYVIPPRRVRYQYRVLPNTIPQWLVFDPVKFRPEQVNHLYGAEQYLNISEIDNLNVPVPLNIKVLTPHQYPGFPYANDASSVLSVDHVLDQYVNNHYFIRRLNFPIMRVAGYGRPTALIQALATTAGVLLQVYCIEDAQSALIVLSPRTHFEMPGAGNLVPLQFTITATALGIINAGGTFNLTFQTTATVQNINSADASLELTLHTNGSVVNINSAAGSLIHFPAQLSGGVIADITIMSWLFVRP